MTYDAAGRLTTVTQPDPDGSGSPELQFTYDSATNLMTSYTTATGATTTLQYDAAGALSSRVEPGGATYQSSAALTAGWADASAGQGTWDNPAPLLRTADVAATRTDPLNHTTSYSYDDLYRRTAITDPLSGVTSFTFDLAGNLISLTDPVGNTTAWDYDGLNRVVAETNELNDSRTFTYDAANNLLTRTDRNGRVIEYAYDALHRRVQEQWLDDQQTVIRTLSFSYDAASQLTAAADPAASYDYQYDALGRRTSVTHDIAGLGFLVVLASAYDAASNRTSLSATIDTTADFVNQYTYDALHRMTRIEQSGQSGGNAVAEKRIDLSYDAASQWQTITRYGDLAATKLVATSDYTFDAAGRLTALTHEQGATPLAGYTWAYDAAHRVTEFTSLLDGTAEYTYDQTDQLTGADYTYQDDEAYGYDANGNRTMIGYATGDNNLVLSDGLYDYQYDAEGNRTRRTHIASGEVTEYHWDHRNRLTQVVTKDATHTVLQTVEYHYDIFNRLVGKSVAYGTDPAEPEDVNYFIYDGERWERGNAGDHLALVFDGNGDLTNRYLHGPVVDQILADEQIDSLTTPGDVLWPLTDNLGTVRDLAAYDDATGDTTVVNHRTYTAFGQILSETDPSFHHRFAFTGREWDEHAGLYRYRARWYDPALGRFLSEDPIGFEAGDANLQRYVANGPTNAVDPSGLTNVEMSQAASQRASQYEQFDRDLQRYVKARRQNPPGVYGPRLNWRDWLMSFFGSTSTLDISAPGLDLQRDVTPTEQEIRDFISWSGHRGKVLHDAWVASWLPSPNMIGAVRCNPHLTRGVTPNSAAANAAARHAAWGGDVNAISGTMERLGQRALRQAGGDWRCAEQLFESYLQGVSNRLGRVNSRFGVEIQPAAIADGQRVPAFVHLHRGRSWSSPLVADAAGNPRLFAYPGSRRLDAGIIDLDASPNSQGLRPLVVGVDITLDASKPDIVPYYQQYFGTIPIYDIRLP
jgi:RHS repeat-associated protein